MAEPETAFLPLLPHRETPNEAVRRVAAWAGPTGPQSLRLRYVLEADSRRIRIPTPGAGGGTEDPLWAHTCFEAFLGLDGSARYLELNFSPSGRWAAYRFESYREGMAPAPLEEPPRLSVRRGEQRLELEVEIRLPAPLPDRRLQVALSTVVEDQEGRLSYWALRHPPGRPDFHHPDGFALALEFPRNPAT